MFPSTKVLPGVPKYSEKKPTNITAVEMKTGAPSNPRPALPMRVLNTLVILSRPDPEMIKTEQLA